MDLTWRRRKAARRGWKGALRNAGRVDSCLFEDLNLRVKSPRGNPGDLEARPRLRAHPVADDVRRDGQRSRPGPRPKSTSYTRRSRCASSAAGSSAARPRSHAHKSSNKDTRGSRTYARWPPAARTAPRYSASAWRPHMRARGSGRCVGLTDGASTSAPRRTSARATASWPCCAAMTSGVAPSRFGAFTSAPAAASARARTARGRSARRCTAASRPCRGAGRRRRRARAARARRGRGRAARRRRAA